MKYLLQKLLKLTQASTFFWSTTASICLGWLVSSNQPILARLINGLGIFCLLMAVFTFGSIEDAPLDALTEARNPENPISRGYVSIPNAWRLSLFLTLIGLLLTLVSSRSTMLINIGLLLVGLVYFHHALKLRQNLLLDALGFSIITSLLPFLGTVNGISRQIGNATLITGILAFFLTYVTYYLMIKSNEKSPASGFTKPKLTLGIMIVLVVIVISTLFTFTFSGLVPFWVSFLMLVLFVIMVYPQFRRRASIQTDAYVHMLVVTYQRALVIALVTYFLSTQIFRILR